MELVCWTRGGIVETGRCRCPQEADSVHRPQALLGRSVHPSVPSSLRPFVCWPVHLSLLRPSLLPLDPPPPTHPQPSSTHLTPSPGTHRSPVLQSSTPRSPNPLHVRIRPHPISTQSVGAANSTEASGWTRVVVMRAEARCGEMKGGEVMRRTRSEAKRSDVS